MPVFFHQFNERKKQYGQFSKYSMCVCVCVLNTLTFRLNVCVKMIDYTCSLLIKDRFIETQ